MEKIGKYQVSKPLGQGGMGVVYLGEDPITGRSVAIKIIREQFANQPELKKRFYTEARSVAKVSHPNITALYEVGEESGRPFIAMEYVPGTDIRKLVDMNIPTPLARKLDVMRQVASGMAAAHTQGVIHRDLKPSNVRVMKTGAVKIIDFGLARIENEGTPLTNSKVGTPHYMSPEQILGKFVDYRTDIFSFGMIFYEFLTNRHPFAADHVTQVIQNIVHQEPPRFQMEPAAVGQDLLTLLYRCLHKERQHRFQGFSEIEQELVQLMQKHGLVLTNSTTDPSSQNTRVYNQGPPKRPPTGYPPTGTPPNRPPTGNPPTGNPPNRPPTGNPPNRPPTGQPIPASKHTVPDFAPNERKKGKAPSPLEAAEMGFNQTRVVDPNQVEQLREYYRQQKKQQQQQAAQGSTAAMVDTPSGIMRAKRQEFIEQNFNSALNPPPPDPQRSFSPRAWLFIGILGIILLLLTIYLVSDWIDYIFG